MATNTTIHTSRNTFYRDHLPQGAKASSLCSDTVALARTPLKTQASLGSTVRFTGAVGGAFAMLGSTKDICDGHEEHAFYTRVGDTQNLQKTKAKIAAGVTGLAGSSIYVIGKFIPLEFTPITDILSSILLGITSLITLVLAFFGLARTSHFQNQIHDFQDNPLEGVRFLLNECTASDDSTIERKLKTTRSRASLAAVHMILSRAPEILSTQDTQAAHALLQDVSSECTKKKAVFAFVIFAALLGLAASILGSMSGAALIALIFGAISVGTNVSLGIANYRASKEVERLLQSFAHQTLDVELTAVQGGPPAQVME